MGDLTFQCPLVDKICNDAAVPLYLSTDFCITLCKHCQLVLCLCVRIYFLHLLYSPLDCLQELGLIRKPASFMTSICDERGQELIYAGMPITEVFKEEMGLGGVLGLLWFQRRLD